MQTAWYLTITKPNMEATVADSMRDAGITHRLYRVQRRIVARGKVSDRLEPVYRGYVFAYANADWYRPIRDMRGVINFLSFDDEGYPSRVDDGEIEKLDYFCNADHIIETPDPAEETVSKYRRGDRIRVTSGPFAMFPGTYLEYVKGSAICEIMIFGRAVPTSLEIHQIEPIEEQRKRKNRKKRAA